MRRALWLIPVLLVALFLFPRRSDGPTEMSSLTSRLNARFGTTDLRYTTTSGHRRLELTLTGERWEGLNDVVPDSARVVARYALEDLMGFERPDTIVVIIRTTNKWGGRVTGSSGVHLATADL